MVAYHRYGHPLGHSVTSTASPETKELTRTLLKQVRQHVPLEHLQAMFLSFLDPRQRLSKKPLPSPPGGFEYQGLPGDQENPVDSRT